MLFVSYKPNLFCYTFAHPYHPVFPSVKSCPQYGQACCIVKKGGLSSNHRIGNSLYSSPVDIGQLEAIFC